MIAHVKFLIKAFDLKQKERNSNTESTERQKTSFPEE